MVRNTILCSATQRLIPSTHPPVPTPHALWLLPSSQMAMASCHATQRPLPWQARKAWMFRRRCWIPLLLEMRARFLSFHAGDFMHALHCAKLVITKVSWSQHNWNVVFRYKSILRMQTTYKYIYYKIITNEFVDAQVFSGSRSRRTYRYKWISESWPAA